MVQYVITPWRNARDLLSLRDKLYPEFSGKTVKDEERRHAVAKVSVWMQRGNCPHLVESTAIMTASLLNDVRGNAPYCVRAAYAAAFCRFVTGLLDSHQNKGHKLSMYSIAKSIGLPATYVELRHQATHEELPSLTKLRIATQKALRWIWDYYWAKIPAVATEQDECDAFVQGMFDARGQGEMGGVDEGGFGEWSTEQLLQALWSLDRRGSSARADELWVQRMQTRIMSEGSLGGRTPRSETDVPKLGTVEDLRSEMMEMEMKLEGQEERLSEEDLRPDEASEGKGWAMWGGPWVPKPIGVI